MLQVTTRARSWGLLLAAAMLAAAAPARAAFDEPIVSARSAGMGGASLAAKGDPGSLFINPAAVAGMKASSAYFSYNDVHAGMPGVSSVGEGFIAAGVPTALGSLAVGASLLS